MVSLEVGMKKLPAGLELSVGIKMVVTGLLFMFNPSTVLKRNKFSWPDSFYEIVKFELLTWLIIMSSEFEVLRAIVVEFWFSEEAQNETTPKSWFIDFFNVSCLRVNMLPCMLSALGALEASPGQTNQVTLHALGGHLCSLHFPLHLRQLIPQT